jgi:type I restriction enzyme S subunit
MELKPRYKQTEVGVIPEDWEVAPLGKRATFKTGPFGSALHQSDYVDGGVPVINPMQIVDGKLFPTAAMSISEAAARRLSDFRLSEGNIVIGRRGEMGRCAFVLPEHQGWLCGTGSMIIRTGPSLEAQFIWRVLASPPIIAEIENASVGSTMINLNQGTLGNLLVPFPPNKAEQAAIGQTLSDADALIESLEQLIFKKRHLKQGVMQELLRPKDWWQPTNLNSIADRSQRWSFTGGPFGSNLKSSDYADEGVRIIQLQNIGDGEFKDDYEIYTSPEKADELLSCNIYPGEIILSKMGDPVARACIIPAYRERYLMCSDGIRLAVDPKRFNTYFVYIMINALEFRTKAANAGTGSTRKRIGLTALRNLEMLCPPLPEQAAIALVLSDMEAEIAALDSKLSKARQLKQGMMQELLTGRIRLI